MKSKLKNKLNKFAIVSLILVGVCGLIYKLRGIFAFGLLFIGLLLSPNPPAPEVTYGEFPIMVTYQVDDEIKTLNDVVICEYDGVENLGTAGKRRKWRDSLKSGNTCLILLKGGNTCLILLKGESKGKRYEISTGYGIADYYMGDLRYNSVEEYEKILHDDRYLGYTEHDGVNEKVVSISKEEALEKYKIKIINIEHSQPIKNSFK